MLAFIGMWEGLIILFVILLLFGSTRFVGAAKGLGKGAREFKKSVTGEDEQQQQLPAREHTRDTSA